MRVFVLLPRSLDAEDWRWRHARGDVPDQTPYGYHHAEALGCEVMFSRGTATRTRWGGFLDEKLRRVLGFDLYHAWRNRKQIFDPSVDVIWTHTEIEHLAVRALCLILNRRCAVMIAQSVWLIDEWPRYHRLRQTLYRILLRNSEVLSFLSPENAEQARKQKLTDRIETLLFGISLDSFPLRPPRERNPGQRIRVLSLGNDRHRDWKTFSNALANRADMEVRIAAGNFPSDLLAENFTASRLNSTDEIRAAYEWADCVVVPLRANMHASGCTTVLEAVALGVPTIVSDVGGIRAYFGDEQVTLPQAGSPEALLEAVLSVAHNPAEARQRSVRAQEHLLDAALSTAGYAARHVALSRDLIGANP
jgi:glycosyltransferase involved in cell wall biosynthesis